MEKLSSDQAAVTPVRVLQVLYSGLGGHGAIAFSLISADREHQWRHDLCFYGIEPLRPAYRLAADQNAVSFSAILKKQGLDLGSYRRFYRYLKSQRPDVILLHSVSLIHIAALYKLRHKVILIMVEHNANQIKSRSEWTWSRLGMKWADRVVYLSDEYRNDVRKKIGAAFKPAKASVIPNGIDLSFFAPGPPTASSPILVSMIGRFAYPKDQKKLVDAVRLIRASTPGLDVRAVLPGSGDQLAEMRADVERANESDIISFPGVLDEGGIRDLLHNTTVYVHVTHGETMSTSIMQAMACGVCVLASDVPGVNNLVDGINGKLFLNQNTSDSLVSALEMLLLNDELREAYAHAGLAFAKERLADDRMFRSYHHLLTTLLKK